MPTFIAQRQTIGPVALGSMAHCSTSKFMGVQRISMRTSSGKIASMSSMVRNRSRYLQIVNTYPEPETEKERSPIDFPQVSWERFVGNYFSLTTVRRHRSHIKSS